MARMSSSVNSAVRRTDAAPKKNRDGKPAKPKDPEREKGMPMKSAWDDRGKKPSKLSGAAKKKGR